MLFLPERATLMDESERFVVPEPSEIDSDGMNIILEWQNFTDEQIIVNYDTPVNGYSTWILIPFVFVFLSSLLGKDRRLVQPLILKDEQCFQHYLA